MRQVLDRLHSYKKLKNKIKYLVLFFPTLGFFISNNNIFGESPDYESYINFFNLIRKETLDEVLLVRFEIGFKIISLILVNLFTSNIIVFSLLVTISLFIKVLSIQFYTAKTNIFLMAIWFYFIRYFPLFELTQIRAGISTGFFLMAYIFSNRYNYKKSIIFYILSITFHYSAIIALPVLLIKKTELKLLPILSLSTFILIYLSKHYLVQSLYDETDLITMYAVNGYGDSNLNPFSSSLFIDWLIIVASIYYWNRLTNISKKIIFIEVIGMCIFYGSIDYPVISYRLREYLSVFWIIFIIDILKSSNTKHLGYIAIALSTVCYFYIYFIREPAFFLN